LFLLLLLLFHFLFFLFSLFPNIERVQILVDGKPIESLGGHIDLSHALPVSR